MIRRSPAAPRPSRIHPHTRQRQRWRDERSSLKGAQVARQRLFVVAVCFLLAFAGLAVRLADLMILEHDRAVRSSQAPARTDLAKRADIVDRNGQLLATSLKTRSVYVSPALLQQPDVAARKLAQALNLPVAQVRQKIATEKKFVWIKRHITPREVYDVNKLGLLGVDFQDEYVRIYPQGRLTSHVVGVTNIDGRGLAGAELGFDSTLLDNETPVTLSLDIRVQQILHDELSKTIATFKAKGGAGLILDSHTAEVIAMVSLPDFDPYQMPKTTRLDTAAAQDSNPMFNRVTKGVYELGSTFKIFTTALALDRGIVTLKTRYQTKNPIRVGGFRITDFKHYGDTLSVEEIFAHSSNIGTAQIALAAGGAAQRDFFKTLGFFSPVPFDLPETAAPLVPTRWSEATVISASFGYGLAITPLHLTNAVATIINGGHPHTPTLLRQDAPLIEAQDAAREESPVLRSAHTSALMRKLMYLAVEDGTAEKAAASGYYIGGKTGTANKSKNGRYDETALLSSFVGAFPIYDPRYVIFMMVDEPKGNRDTFGYATGGWTAVPAARAVIERMSPVVGLSPFYSLPPRAKSDLGLHQINMQKNGSPSHAPRR